MLLAHKKDFSLLPKHYKNNKPYQYFKDPRYLLSEMLTEVYI